MGNVFHRRNVLIIKHASYGKRTVGLPTPMPSRPRNEPRKMAQESASRGVSLGRSCESFALGNGVPAMASHLTPEVRDRLAKLRCRGWDQKSIRRAIGRCPATVRRASAPQARAPSRAAAATCRLRRLAVLGARTRTAQATRVYRKRAANRRRRWLNLDSTARLWLPRVGQVGEGVPQDFQNRPAVARRQVGKLLRLVVPA